VVLVLVVLAGGRNAGTGGKGGDGGDGGTWGQDGEDGDTGDTGNNGNNGTPSTGSHQGRFSAIIVPYAMRSVMQLRPHQQDALTAMLAHDKGRSSSPRVVVRPCV
jgi:hypothetical protein